MSEAYILCVDDERMNLDIISDLLDDEFEIGLANDGQQCLDSVANRKPDLILMDVNMPLMNGLGACKKLRADPDTKDIIIHYEDLKTGKSGLGNGLTIMFL